MACFLSAADDNDKEGTDDNNEDASDNPHHQNFMTTNMKNKQVTKNILNINRKQLCNSTGNSTQSLYVCSDCAEIKTTIWRIKRANWQKGMSLCNTGFPYVDGGPRLSQTFSFWSFFLFDFWTFENKQYYDSDNCSRSIWPYLNTDPMEEKSDIGRIILSKP